MPQTQSLWGSGMMYTEKWEFDLRVLDEMDRPEYQSMVAAIKSILEPENPDVSIHLESVKTDLMCLTIERVRCP